MASYGVLYFQSGGCDYTIGCGYRFEELPESVDSFEKAKEWIVAEAEDSSILDLVNNIKIFEISRKVIIDYPATLIPSVPKEDAKTIERRRMYENLKKEFGN